MLLAVFLLPVAVMFFITGALYIWEIKGKVESHNHNIDIDSSFSGELTEFIALTENRLNTMDLPTPTGKTKIRREGESTIFEWSGSAIEVKVETRPEHLKAQMEIRETNWYRHLVQLHKAKGGFLFKLYATLLSIALLLIIFTGFIMAWQMPKLRKLTAMTATCGFAAFIILVIYN